jgi:4-aminobutyrate aminotransferase-like enzyme
VLAAANAVIDIYKDKNLIENAQEMEKYMDEKMEG